MKAKILAEILLQYPELEVVFFSHAGPTLVEKVIKCDLSTDKMYSFEKIECLAVDDNGKVRKTWLEAIKGEVLNQGDFVYDDTGEKS